jgi:hypothetical protein
MTEAAIDRRAAAKHTTEMVMNQELERVERTATQRIRDGIHDIPQERRHLVTIGASRIEMIETAAVEEVLTS